MKIATLSRVDAKSEYNTGALTLILTERIPAKITQHTLREMPDIVGVEY